MRFIVAGAGYTGRRLALALKNDGFDTLALTRSAESAFPLEQEGIEALALNLDEPPAADVIQRMNHFGAGCIVYLVPPPRGGVGDPRLERFLSLATPPARFIYISTSGVYGDCDGRWVSEDVAAKPESARARRRFTAEIMLSGWCAENNVESVVLRVPGIYGPGRLPLGRLERRQPALQPDDAPFSNRIHVDDLVNVIRCAAERGRAGRVYNVSDTSPMNATAYLDLVAEIAGLPAPDRVRADDAHDVFSDTQWSFLRESKRLDVRRMREELGFTPAYADPADGIRASLADT